MKSSNLLFHYISDCFSPYMDFFNRHTFLCCPSWTRPCDWCMNILSSRSPWWNVVLTSIFFHLNILLSNHGQNYFDWGVFDHWWEYFIVVNPLFLNESFCNQPDLKPCWFCSKYPFLLFENPFTWYQLLFLGLSTSSQVWFDSNDLISSTMAWNHSLLWLLFIAST